MTQRMGDARAQEIVRAHNTIVRREVQSRGGTEIKHTGDGIMATFPSAARAVAAAVAIQEGTRVYSEAHPATAFQVNSGLNAGEPVAEDADVFGTAVQLAARTCAEAHGGKILATNVVRELVYGKGALFDDIGATSLKGYDQPIHLYEVGVGADGIDEGAAAGRNWRVPAVLGGTVALIAIVTVGAAAFSLRGDGGDAASADAGPALTDYRFSASGETEIVSLTGDCVVEDVVIIGEIQQQVQGDVVGTALTTFEGRRRLSDDCDSLVIASATTYDFAGRGSFVDESEGFTRRQLGELDAAETSATDTLAGGVAYNGTGDLSGVTGTIYCAASSLRDEEISLSNQSECVLRMASASERVAVTAIGVADTSDVTTQLGASGVSNNFKFLVVFRNNSEADLVDAVLSLRLPEGVSIEATAFGEQQPASNPLSWTLGTIPAGENGSIEFRMQLIESDADSFTITPHIEAEGADIQHMEPTTLTVVR